jgi:hypothetical protein
MKRRDFLVGGAAGVATLGAGSSAEAATTPDPTFDPAVVEAALQRIDERMASFQKLDLSPDQHSALGQPEVSRERVRLVRSAIRTLYFTGAFMELEEHQRCHPGVQDRMRRLQGEMDHAVCGMTDLLEGLSPEDLRKLQQAFKDDPEIAMRLGEQFNDIAKEDGFGFRRRTDLRMGFDDLARRMSAQNPALLVDPVLKKVRHAQERHRGDAELERSIRIQAGESAFWAFQQKTRTSVARWDNVYKERERTDRAGLENTYPEEDSGGPAPTVVDEDAKENARGVLRTGGTLMGLGLGSIALGGVFFLISSAVGTSSLAGNIFLGAGLVFGVTVGPILLATGLIVTLVGAIMLAAA